MQDSDHTLENIQQTATVPVEISHLRLDQIAAKLFTDFSRSKLQQWIKEGMLLVDGKPASIRSKLKGEEQLSIDATQEIQGQWIAVKMPLDIVFEDEHILVVNKPVGLVVHPAAGHHNDTLLNGLLAHIPANENLPRAGIVHRLDKDTSGLMVVSKSLKAQQHLVQQLQTHSMGREYHAITQGQLVSGGTINEPIARHQTQRTRMAVRGDGKKAVTHYSLLKKFKAHTHIKVNLETGRTHQIRVHMAHLGFPLVGDATYAGRERVPAGLSASTREYLKRFERQALHAKTLRLVHPETNEMQEFHSPLPDDFAQLLKVLEDEQSL